MPTINGQAIVTNDGSGYKSGDIQVPYYIELEDTFENVKNAISRGTVSTYYDALKSQINKWLQTTILNNTTVTLSKPKPCILKFNDMHLVLYRYNATTFNNQYLYTYTFTTIDDTGAGEAKNIYKFEIQLATTKNALSIAFADYSINRLDASINEISGSGFNPVETVTDDGQILIGYRDGRYTWATQTVQELQETADGANRTANEAKTSVTALNSKVTTLEQNVATKSTFILLSDLYPDSNVQDGTYADYPYRYDYVVTGLTVNDVVEVILNLPAATSGNIAPITRSDAGKFSIYCKTDSSISDTISAIVFKGGN